MEHRIPVQYLKKCKLIYIPSLIIPNFDSTFFIFIGNGGSDHLLLISLITSDLYLYWSWKNIFVDPYIYSWNGENELHLSKNPHNLRSTQVSPLPAVGLPSICQWGSDFPVSSQQPLAFPAVWPSPPAGKPPAHWGYSSPSPRGPPEPTSLQAPCSDSLEERGVFTGSRIKINTRKYLTQGMYGLKY